jgi:hypothetical protein
MDLVTCSPDKTTKTNLHCTKLLRNNTVHFGFNVDGNLIRLHHSNDVAVLDRLSYLDSPFHDCSLQSETQCCVSENITEHRIYSNTLNSTLTSVMESPMDGTLTLFFSNRGSVADTKPLVCWRAELAPSCEVHRPTDRAFRVNNRCRCSDDDILELLATTINPNDLVKRSAIILSRSKLQPCCFVPVGSGGTGRSFMGRNEGRWTT